MTQAPLLIATAGHVDHGKSTLVKTLTGTDPDRWVEEQRRGITLDLGYAHLRSGARTYSFVDVPGHEKFIHNMLAGVGAIDGVLFVIAADASIMPQTREHAQALAFLGVTQVCVVLSKIDLIDDELLELLREEVADWLLAFGWEQAPVVAFSAKRPETKAAVLAALAAMPKREPLPGQGFRLSVDRVFTAHGSGTVVTGTVERGTLCKEDSVFVQPLGIEGRIRQLQVHGETVAAVSGLTRVALNLSDVHYSTLTRGHLVFARARPPMCRKVLVRIHAFDAEWTPGPRHLFHIHHLAAHGQARLVWHHEGLAMLALVEPYSFWALDRGLIRDGSPLRVIAGFEVLDPHPHQTKWRQVTARIANLPETFDLHAWQAWYLQSNHGFMEISAVEERCGEPLPSDLSATMVQLDQTQMIRAELWGQLNESFITALKACHRKLPLYERVPLSQFLAQAGKLGGSAELAAKVLERAVAEGRVILSGDRLKLTQHRVIWKEADRAKLRLFLDPISNGSGMVELKDRKDETLSSIAKMLLWEKYLVALSEDLCIGYQALNRLLGQLHAKYQGHSFSIKELKDEFQFSRKYAIPLLEYLDKTGCTRREGECRTWIARELPILQSEWSPPT